jgi:type IV pilus assembly protein PilC
MEFRCRVASATGQIVEATYVAESEARLRHELEEKGLYLLSVQGRGAVKIGQFRLHLPQRRKVPTDAFLVFNQALATLLKAGLPLVQSLDILRRRVLNPIFKASLDDVYERVRSGSALSEAFDAQRLFSGVYIASLMAGEKSGSLEQVLRRFVQHVKVLASVRKHVVSALIYPAVLVVLSMGVVSYIVFNVVPQFRDFYAEVGHGKQLPLSTRILVTLSTSLIQNAIWILAGAAAIAVLVVATLRQAEQRKRFHAFLLRLPYFGPIARKFSTSQVARTLATLLSGGIPLVNALEISANATGNRSIAAHLSVVARQVREGRSLAGALTERNIFPPVAIEMVEVGESTGALAEMLNSIADFYDEETETSLERFSNLIQPVLLIVMGAILAALIMSLYMPLFQLSSVMGG